MCSGCLWWTHKASLLTYSRSPHRAHTPAPETGGVWPASNDPLQSELYFSPGGWMRGGDGAPGSAALEEERG